MADSDNNSGGVGNNGSSGEEEDRNTRGMADSDNDSGGGGNNRSSGEKEDRNTRGMTYSDNNSRVGGNNGSNGEEDKFLPIANVVRIMRKALPAHAKIAKDASEVMQVCVSEFIHFITTEASQKCMHQKRKTIHGDDLLGAMKTLDFDKHIDPLKLYLQKYREFKEKKKGTGIGAPGGGWSASSSLSQLTDVLGGGVNVGGSYGAGLIDSGAGGVMGMGQHQQHQLGSGFFPGSSGSYGAGMYSSGGTGMMGMDQHQQHQLGSGFFPGSSSSYGTGGAGSGMMGMGQYQQHQLGSGLFPGSSGSGGSSSPPSIQGQRE